jgi:DNA-binding NarL/FixJ family response regulator
VTAPLHTLQGHEWHTYQPTPWERRLLQLLADGRTNQQIADHLHIAHLTALEDILELERKLGARNRANTIHIAWKRGLLGGGQR